MRWIAIVGLVVVIGSGLGCSKKKDAPPFSCEALQQRAEACQGATLDRVRADLASRDDKDLQFRMFESRFKKKLEAKATQAQCEKFSKDPAYAPRVEAMKTCQASDGCESFAKCMLSM